MITDKEPAELGYRMFRHLCTYDGGTMYVICWGGMPCLFYLFMRLSVRTGHLYNLSCIFLLRRLEFVENKVIVEGTIWQAV